MDAEEKRVQTPPDSLPPHSQSLPFHPALSSGILIPVDHITSSCAVWNLFGLNQRETLARIRRRDEGEGKVFLWLFSAYFSGFCPESLPWLVGGLLLKVPGSSKAPLSSSISCPCSLACRNSGSSATVGLCFLLIFCASFNPPYFLVLVSL